MAFGNWMKKENGGGGGGFYSSFPLCNFCLKYKLGQRGKSIKKKVKEATERGTAESWLPSPLIRANYVQEVTQRGTNWEGSIGKGGRDEKEQLPGAPAISA